MPVVTSQRRVLAGHAALAMGVEKPPILQFWDENRQSNVYVLEAANRPQDGVSSYATIGLSDHPLMFKGREFDSRVELAGACGSAFLGFANVLATTAFCVINSGWFCALGIIFPDVVSMNKAPATLSDICFAHPFLWAEELKSTLIGDRRVTWLLAVPVSKRRLPMPRATNQSVWRHASRKWILISMT
ncbi:suppressor of fused domain protein [Burkholderia multivorans]|uniref:Suppressor of fused-like domain-containing protein n=1 Tax=Burkholderia multivorans TaxID=87883 RepID=A0A8E2RX82_9BURK|nr:suppressor of fused domain protein [Burkholderia multivorans]MDN8092991.1 suppressor of fused domain protein [Burkholderia multivorans]MDN8098492.1 suppressor of fused domain protein [Burkholderia multivorans]MDN8109587.1 suppressor of fused domain protein [Burkholderia multivorans]MDN8129471.1 suppressor of fused domain protein [Burkholderia multivorans]MDN8135127.1 suppressor of fused domain protein [Burkholderia multivorans]